MKIRLTKSNEIAVINDGIISYFHFEKGKLVLSFRSSYPNDRVIIEEKTQIPIFIKNLITNTIVGAWKLKNFDSDESYPGKPKSFNSSREFCCYQGTRTYVRSIKVGNLRYQQECTLLWFLSSPEYLDHNEKEINFTNYCIIDSPESEYSTMVTTGNNDASVLLEDIGEVKNILPDNFWNI